MPPPPGNVNPGGSFPHSVMLSLSSRVRRDAAVVCGNHLTLHQRPSNNQSTYTVPKVATQSPQRAKSLQNLSQNHHIHPQNTPPVGSFSKTNPPKKPSRL